MIYGTNSHLERIERLRFEAAPCFVFVARGVEDDAMSVNLWVRQFLCFAGGKVRESSNGESSGRYPFAYIASVALADSGNGRVPFGVVERCAHCTVMGIKQPTVAND
jgi:hypothetical protein